MLCVTVVLELWHFVVTAVSTGNSAALVASASQLLIGAAIAWTLIYALWTEKAGYLLPYLVLQVSVAISSTKSLYFSNNCANQELILLALRCAHVCLVGTWKL
jgi:hypothetical protein